MSVVTVDRSWTLVPQSATLPVLSSDHKRYLKIEQWTPVAAVSLASPSWLLGELGVTKTFFCCLSLAGVLLVILVINQQHESYYLIYKISQKSLIYLWRKIHMTTDKLQYFKKSPECGCHVSAVKRVQIIMTGSVTGSLNDILMRHTVTIGYTVSVTELKLG